MESQRKSDDIVLEVRMSEPISRREFIKGATAIIGGMITAVIGLPTIAYLIDPALKQGAKEGWIPIGKLADMPVRKPTSFSFTRVQVNGWERTSTRSRLRTRATFRCWMRRAASTDC